MKVNLPKVEDNIRIELNVLKARRDDRTLDKTFEYLLSLPTLSHKTIERLNNHRKWGIKRGDPGESWDDLVNRILDDRENTPLGFIGRAIEEAMTATKEEIDTWEDFHPEFRKWLKYFAKDEVNIDDSKVQ